MYTQIINPITKRKVFINSRLGRKILYNYVLEFNNLTGGSGTIEEEEEPIRDFINKMRMSEPGKIATDPDADHNWNPAPNGRTKYIVIK